MGLRGGGIAMYCAECGHNDMENKSGDLHLNGDHLGGVFVVKDTSWLECPQCHAQLYFPKTCQDIDARLRELNRDDWRGFANTLMVMTRYREEGI